MMSLPVFSYLPSILRLSLLRFFRKLAVMFWSDGVFYGQTCRTSLRVRDTAQKQTPASMANMIGCGVGWGWFSKRLGDEWKLKLTFLSYTGDWLSARWYYLRSSGILEPRHGMGQAAICIKTKGQCAQ